MKSNERSFQIYVCHANEDAAVVYHLAEFLRKQAYDPWVENERILPGQNKKIEVEKALNQSNAILICFSKSSVAKEGFIQAEFKKARQIQEEKPTGTIHVIPVRLDECEVPFEFKDLQWVEFPENGEKLVKALEERRKQLSLKKENIAKKPRLTYKPISKIPAKIFICYRRNSEIDRRVAELLYSSLSSNGHVVFIDTTMRVGTEWLKNIDDQIKNSDFLITLISKDSADSEMVLAEVQRAYDYRHKYGHPKTLPVRIKYEDLLPYSLSAYLGSLQYLLWNDDEDNERIVSDILSVISGGDIVSPQKITTTNSIEYSDDGRMLQSSKDVPVPLHQFDPRILEEINIPGGTLKLSDKFYITREADEKLYKQIAKPGATITIRASRQTGKSSLLVRGLSKARSKSKIVHLDLQSIPRDELENQDLFLLHLARVINNKLSMDIHVLEEFWKRDIGSQDKLTLYLEEYVLPSTEEQIILALDEADRLLNVTYYSDFFALLRYWHNNRAMEELWDRLNLIMVIATEPYLLISNPSQSPFNVGLTLNLDDFNLMHTKELNIKHGSPLSTENEINEFYDFFSGHPFLTRKALYTLAIDGVEWKNLLQTAPDDHGPFGDHLRRQYWLLSTEPTLQNALKQVISHNRCSDDLAVFRLLRSGLIKGRGDIYKCRCGLYENYFKNRL